MADEEQVEVSAADVIARCGEKMGEASSADLTALLGREITLRPSGVERISAGRVAEKDSPIVHQLCRATGGVEADVHVLVPRPDANRLAALQLESDDDDPKDAPLDTEMRAALQVVTKLVVSALENVLQEEGIEASIEMRDAREVPEPASDPTWLTDEQFQRLRFDLTMERLPEGRIDLLLTLEGGAAEAGGPGSTILFLSDRDAERESLEDLAGALGWPVSVASADRLDPACIADAGAIVVPWVVGGRSGLELVESLAAGAAEGVPVLMAAEQPTRTMVVAALRAGAASFVQRPYAGEELRRRILEARGERVAGSAEDAGAAPSSGEEAGENA
jgi:DNA-binding NarL/FixJ family response regulator